MHGELVLTKNDGVPQGLLNAFSHLSAAEKKRYIRENLRYLASILDQERANASSSLIEGPYRLSAQAKSIQVHPCKNTYFCFDGRDQVLKLETSTRTMLLKDHNNIKMIDLQNYLVREDKNLFSKSRVILEPIITGSHSWGEIKRYEFKLTN
jgi:hypothetical protein